MVVVIDEYDTPLHDVLTDPELAPACQDYLREFYSVLDDCKDHLRFVYITGITKFSGVGMLSGLNDLIDISFDPQYATICGFTERELDTTLAPELEGLDRKKIRDWYSGYSWRGEKVYNPYGMMSFLDRREFYDWWFESGSPRYLYELLLQEKGSLAMLEKILQGFWAPAHDISLLTVNNIKLEPMSFQAGYLTIEKERVNKHGQIEYYLAIPNFEVRLRWHQTLLTYLLTDAFSSYATKKEEEELIEYLAKNNFEDFQLSLKLLFKGAIGYWNRRAKIDHHERAYAVALYSFFADLRLDVRAADPSSEDRSDIVLLYAGQVFVFALAVTEDKSDNEIEEILDQAMQQIQDRKYEEPYKKRGEPIHPIALAFGIEEKNLVGMKIGDKLFLNQ